MQFAFGPKDRPKKGHRRAKVRGLVIGATFAVVAFTMIAAAQWGANVQPSPNSKGYGKSSALANVFVDSVDISASLVGDFSPDEGNVGCPASCGDLSVKLTNTHPSLTVHLSSITFAGAGNPAICQVGIFPASQTQTINVTLAPGAQSATLVFPDVLHMGATAPESCANTVFEIPITGLVGNRV
jgi:hypothetical protein